MANEIKTEIILDLQDYKTELKGAEVRAGKSGKKAGKAFGKNVERRIGKSASFISKKFLALGSVIAGAFAGRIAINAAVAQEQSLAKLNAALLATGEFSQQTSKEFQDLATSLQQATGVGDEIILQGAALAQTFTQNAEQTKELTKAALDFSKAADLNFTEAIRRLGRATKGTVDDVAKFDKRILNLTKSQLEAGGAARLLAETFKGVAAAQSKTFGGSIQKLSANFGDFLERIGDLIIKSPLIVKVIDKISSFFITLGDKIADIGKRDVFRDLLLQAVNFAVGITRFVLPPIELLVNGMTVGFNVVKTAILTAFAVGVKAAQLFLDTLAFFDDSFKDAAAGAAEFSKDVEEQLVKAAVDTKDSIGNIFEFDGTKASEDLLVELQIFLENSRETARVTGEELGKSLNDPIKDETIRASQFINNALDETFSRAALTGDAIKKQLQGKATFAFKQFRDGITSSFSSIGTALAKGENGFAAFGKAILGLFGDLAIQLGQFYFLLGLANLFLNPAAAAQMIAGGIGLQILGGFLKAISGGGGSTAGAAGGAGGAGATGGALVEGADSLNQEPLEVQQEEETRVTINVQGNILDRRETGIELAEIINEAFGTNDVVIAQAE